MSIKAVDYNPHLALQSQLKNSEESSKNSKYLSSFMGMPIGEGFEQTTTWTALKTAHDTFQIMKVTHHCYDVHDITLEPHDGPIIFTRFEVNKILDRDGTVVDAYPPIIFSRLQEVAFFFNQV